MFWTITISVVAALIALVSWVCRPKGTSKGNQDLDHAARQAKWKSQGKVSYYDHQ